MTCLNRGGRGKILNFNKLFSSSKVPKFLSFFLYFRHNETSEKKYLLPDASSGRVSNLKMSS